MLSDTEWAYICETSVLTMVLNLRISFNDFRLDYMYIMYNNHRGSIDGGTPRSTWSWCYWLSNNGIFIILFTLATEQHGCSVIVTRGIQTKTRKSYPLGLQIQLLTLARAILLLAYQFQ